MKTPHCERSLTSFGALRNKCVQFLAEYKVHGGTTHPIILLVVLLKNEGVSQLLRFRGRRKGDSADGCTQTLFEIRLGVLGLFDGQTRCAPAWLERELDVDTRW